MYEGPAVAFIPQGPEGPWPGPRRPVLGCCWLYCFLNSWHIYRYVLTHHSLFTCVPLLIRCTFVQNGMLNLLPLQLPQRFLCITECGLTLSFSIIYLRLCSCQHPGFYVLRL